MTFTRPVPGPELDNIFEESVYITVVPTNHNLGPLPSLHRDAAWSDEQKAGSN